MVRRQLTGAANRLYECKTCKSYTTTDYASLMRHRKTVHKPRKQYHCPYINSCHFKNTQRSKVDEHVRNYHTEHTFQDNQDNFDLEAIAQEVFPPFPTTETPPETVTTMPMQSPPQPCQPSWPSACESTAPQENYLPVVPTPAYPGGEAEGGLPIPATLREMPEVKTVAGEVIARARAEAAISPTVSRLWQHPSTLVDGLTYRKVSERVMLPSGIWYEGTVEELVKPLKKRHKSRRHRSRHHSRSRSVSQK